jgi:hypothetical protein
VHPASTMQGPRPITDLRRQRLHSPSFVGSNRAGWSSHERLGGHEVRMFDLLLHPPLLLSGLCCYAFLLPQNFAQIRGDGLRSVWNFDCHARWRDIRLNPLRTRERWLLLEWGARSEQGFTC